MLRKLRRITILALAFLLVFSLFPPSMMERKASGSGVGLNLLAPFNTEGLTQNNPLETNQSTVSISGTPVGIDPGNVSYRVVRVGTQQILDESPAPMVVNGNFTFGTVPLFPGLNRIELYGTVGTSTTTMEQRFVYFFNSPNMFNLSIIDSTNIPVINFSPPAYDAGDHANTFNESIFDRVLRVTNFPLN